MTDKTRADICPALEARDRATKWRIEWQPIGGRGFWRLARWRNGPAYFGSNCEALKALHAIRKGPANQTAEFRVVKPGQ